MARKVFGGKVGFREAEMDWWTNGFWIVGFRGPSIAALTINLSLFGAIYAQLINRT
jgi:hypothetical protein